MFGSVGVLVFFSFFFLVFWVPGEGMHPLGTEINHSTNVQFLCEAALVSF